MPTRPITGLLTRSLSGGVTGVGGGYSPPAANYYVSNEATNGYATGLDTNDGLSKSTPFLTIEKALTVATAGQTVVVNGATHTAATAFTAAVGISLYPQTFRGVTLRSPSGQSQVLLTNIPTAATLRIGPFIIDAQGHAAKRCVAIGNASKNTITFSGTSFRNYTTNAVRATVVGTKVSMTCTNIDVSASAGLSALFLTALVDSAIVVDGMTVALSVAGSGGGAVELTAEASGYVGVTARVTGVTGTITQAGTSGDYFAVKLLNIPGTIVESCNVTVSGTSWGYGVWISADPSAPRDASNAIVRNNNMSVFTPNGVLILIGQDTSGAANYLCNSPLVYGNTLATEGTTTGTHGIELGWITAGKVYRNRVAFGYVGILAKGTTGATKMFNNILTDSGSAYPIRAKAASGAAFYNNTAYLSSGSGGYGIYCAGDTTVSIPSTGVVFRNNIIYAKTQAAALAFVSAAEAGPTAASDATLEDNLYFAETAPSNLFSYQGTTYASIAAWQAAREPSAAYADPQFTDFSGFRLAATSPAKSSGVTIEGLTDDYYGSARGTPPSVGAVE